jgi:hypothetical protein
MDDMANIIELVLNNDHRRQIDTSHILTEQNIREAAFFKNLLWLKTDPDYEEGYDERVDKVMAEHTLDPKLLQGIKMMCILTLLHDDNPFVPNPASPLLVMMYDCANALLLENDDACE